MFTVLLVGAWRLVAPGALPGSPNTNLSDDFFRTQVIILQPFLLLMLIPLHFPQADSITVAPSSMDPINVMTSLVGLLGSAGKVVVLLLAVKRSISEAPQLMDQMLAQVKELEISFSAVQSCLLGIWSAPKTRISMIRVEQIIATLTEAVLTFSELEALITSISEDDGMPLKTRLMFHWKQDIVASIMVRLERHKSSLSLMLNIVQW
jgi:hypothetical protein